MEIIIVQILMYWYDGMELSSNKSCRFVYSHSSFSLSLLRVSHLLVFRGIMQVSLIDHKWAEDKSS